MQRQTSVPPPRRPLGRAAPAMRPSNARLAAPSRNGFVSPTAPAALLPTAQKSPSTSLKRKERDFDEDSSEETNINVVVRCRGRNDREVKENSGVVVSTDGVKGNTVELSMGPNAISNKSYRFDRVFSSAADQAVIFEEVVAPILDEVMNGFNCTIFAYGQTGTGKTYTMSGDISDILPIPDTAGIIPRSLHSLFDKLEQDSQETTVKCSFIELYNEELRDLLSADDVAKLKLFEDANKKSASTIVQGMEEFHITSAAKGLEFLRLGSHKRQVAATKCNDLSSRSHTVFTVTVLVKRVLPNGEAYVSAGKLNLVDLAGSENIQRSGAENKRATEAGLINKSLLTLGRVINALVDKNSHIPYRESKLTRLLQDSLGGRTKTCIIATLSPSKSNLEETISTLDYAFRAKNIRNKPQTNPLISKKTLIREFTVEIEKLKSELIATRMRNGVYLTAQNFEEITTQSESRRILSEEQRDKIETMEVNLRNKTQELFALTNTVKGLKLSQEEMQVVLGSAQSALKVTQTQLLSTTTKLAEETLSRQAHQATGEQLTRRGQELITTLDHTTGDINGLREKLKRKSDLHVENKSRWTAANKEASDISSTIQDRLSTFETHHKTFLEELSSKIASHVDEEMTSLREHEMKNKQDLVKFDSLESKFRAQDLWSREELGKVLQDITLLKSDVKQKVGDGLDGLSAAAQRISADVLTGLDSFHSQLHSSYATLGKDLKHTFDDLVQRLKEQQTEAENLRHQLTDMGAQLAKANERASQQMKSIVQEERTKSAKDQADMLREMARLLDGTSERQMLRLESQFNSVDAELESSTKVYGISQAACGQSMDAWSVRGQGIVEGLLKSRESVKTKIKQDWGHANEQHASIQSTTQAVQSQTLRIVDTQMNDMDNQLQRLDHVMNRVQNENDKHQEIHLETMTGMSDITRACLDRFDKHLTSSSDQIQSARLEAEQAVANPAIDKVIQDVRHELQTLDKSVGTTPMAEYEPTGTTPPRVQYSYPTTLATESPFIQKSPRKDSQLKSESPSKSTVHTDESAIGLRSSSPKGLNSSRRRSQTHSSHSSLRELDVNALPAKADSLVFSAPEDKSENMQPPLKRQNNASSFAGMFSSVSMLTTGHIMTHALAPLSKTQQKRAEGRENEPYMAEFAGRMLRSRASLSDRNL